MSALELSVPNYEQQTLFSLTEMTVVTTRSISRIKEDIKSAAEILKDTYSNNQFYRNKADELTEKKKDLTVILNNIHQATDVAAVGERLKELRRELKEKKQSVSEYVLEAQRIGGITEIDVDGQMYEIIKSAKLVKKASM